MIDLNRYFYDDKKIHSLKLTENSLIINYWDCCFDEIKITTEEDKKEILKYYINYIMKKGETMGRIEMLTKTNNLVQTAYKSDFEFKKYEIEDEELILKLSKSEEEVMKSGKVVAKESLKLGRKFFEIQELLSNCKSGTFVAWIKYMNIDKNFVYRKIDAWKLFMKYQNPMIAEASVRTIEFIKKNDEILETKKINEILEEPKSAPEKIKEIQQAEIVEEEKTIEDKVSEIDKRIEAEYEKIAKSEEKIKLLKEKKNKLKMDKIF